MGKTGRVSSVRERTRERAKVHRNPKSLRWKNRNRSVKITLSFTPKPHKTAHISQQKKVQIDRNPNVTTTCSHYRPFECHNGKLNSISTWLKLKQHSDEMMAIERKVLLMLHHLIHGQHINGRLGTSTIPPIDLIIVDWPRRNGIHPGKMRSPTTTKKN